MTMRRRETGSRKEPGLLVEEESRSDQVTGDRRYPPVGENLARSYQAGRY